MRKSKVDRCQCCNKSLANDCHLVFGDEGKRQNIATLLFDYIKKSLNENDGLNYAICDPCWQQLIQYNDFQQKCIRANELSNESDDDNCEVAAEPEIVTETNDSFDASYDLMKNDILYEDSEYLEEFQNDSDFDNELNEMNVEYLEENDAFDDENVFNQDVQPDKKKLPFDFTSVLVKPFFVLGIGNLKKKIEDSNPFAIFEQFKSIPNICRFSRKQRRFNSYQTENIRGNTTPSDPFTNQRQHSKPKSRC